MGMFDIFNRSKGLPDFDGTEIADESLPDMEGAEPATVAEAVHEVQESRRAQRERAAKPAAKDAEVIDDELPSVNRRRGNSKLVNYIGLVVIIVVGIGMIVAVNGKKAPPKAKGQADPDRVANTLPPLAMAAPAMPPLPPSAGAPAVAAFPAVPALNSATVTPPQGQGGTGPIPLQSGSRPASGAQGRQPGQPADWTDRKRDGSLIVGDKDSNIGGPVAPAPVPVAGSLGSLSMDGGGARTDLAAKLEPTPLRGTSASLLPDRNFLITKGRLLDCAIETALDSTLPGMTTCRLTRDVYSDNTQVLLLERGTQLEGEYQGGIKQGQARLFVLWTRAKTPKGVVVTLNSPGTDALGRTGLDGNVDTHFFQRFGAAIMTSLVKDGLAYAAARQSNGGGTVVYGNTQQAGEQLSGKMLDATANIPPTLSKNQGDHIQVMVGRDLDFSAVYALKVN
jgi:type IV secretion system protein VirB10